MFSKKLPKLKTLELLITYSIFPKSHSHRIKGHVMGETTTSQISDSFVYLEIPVHNLGGVQVVQSGDYFGTVEARAVLREHPLSRQMEKQLQDKQQGQDCNNY